MITIKRYQNRKLYSPFTKNYITTKQFYDMFQKDRSVRVVQNNTGEDVTVKVLVSVLGTRNISLDKISNFIDTISHDATTTSQATQES